jgi:hypothetical protein
VWVFSEPSRSCREGPDGFQDLAGNHVWAKPAIISLDIHKSKKRKSRSLNPVREKFIGIFVSVMFFVLETITLNSAVGEMPYDKYGIRIN